VRVEWFDCCIFIRHISSFLLTHFFEIFIFDKYVFDIMYQSKGAFYSSVNNNKIKLNIKEKIVIILKNIHLQD